MHSILKYILKIWRQIFPSKLDKVNRELEKAVIQQEKERIRLKREIYFYTLEKFGIHISDYIPPRGVNTYHIYQVLKKKYAGEIKDLSLVLNYDLTWKK